ncbi:MAG: STAS domain-containing protein [Planctomycetota bacterium]
MPPPSRLVVQTIKDVTVVTFTDTSVVDAQLIEGIKRELFDLVDQQKRGKLVLDMTKVQYLSSSALGVLIPLHEKTAKLKGRLVLCSVSPDIMKVFKITKLDKIFSFKNTASDALADFGVTVPA